MQPVKVVIADDDALVRLDLKLALEELGHRVLGEAEDGQQAVFLARTLQPDLLILDVMMPKLDGLDVARAVRQENLAPVALLSAYSDETLRERADEAGVLAYLRKPFRKEDLAPAIAIALGRDRERRGLQAEIEDLKGKMEARKLVGRAKALLMERHHLTEREAFHRIQAQSQSLQKAPHEIAQAIILAGELGI